MNKVCAVVTGIFDNTFPFIMSLCQSVKVSHDSDSFIFLVCGTLSLCSQICSLHLGSLIVASSVLCLWIKHNNLKPVSVFYLVKT